VLYKAVNIAMLQGNFTSDSGINFNILLDHRKAPILQAESVIPVVGGSARSVGDVKKILSSHDIYSYVSKTVPDTDLALFGATRQVTNRWQLGGNVRVNRTSSIDGVPAQPGIVGASATSASGNTYTYSALVIGADTIFTNDTSVINFSYANGPHSDGQNISLSNSALFRERWRVDSSLQLYHAKADSTSDNKLTCKITPTIRIGYRWKDNMTLETQFGVEKTREHGTTTSTDTLREFMFVGYRWDFM
jgi:hypothetical protein